MIPTFLASVMVSKQEAAEWLAKAVAWLRAMTIHPHPHTTEEQQRRLRDHERLLREADALLAEVTHADPDDRPTPRG